MLAPARAATLTLPSTVLAVLKAYLAQADVRRQSKRLPIDRSGY